MKSKKVRLLSTKGGSLRKASQQEPNSSMDKFDKAMKKIVSVPKEKLKKK